ncbi:MAG TPA: hypothetical protein VGL24_00290, partial [Chthoniobacterales bacterium]
KQWPHLGNSFHASRLYGFFCELRRRKVYRVAVGYAVAGWLIIQVAVTVFPILNFPDWSTRLVVLLILGGFPIALVLGWAFDFGPAGIHITPEPVADQNCPPAYPGRRKNLFVLALAGLTISAVVGYFLFARSASPLDKSIAVLPFNEAAHNAREIGKTLGVASILEGSVRRDGKRVRVNVQLIDASNDKHIWAQIYDRELTDVFAIQTDLAQEIASALQATLSAGKQERTERERTQNGDAYLLYLSRSTICLTTPQSAA